MTWAKLDDAILDNPKIVRAGPIGFALHVAAITYCSRNLTDGFVPYGQARRLLSSSWTEDDGDRVKVMHLAMTSGMSGSDGDEVIDHIVALLCEIGLWHQVPHGYELHDYLDYNPSKDEVLAERAKKQAAGRAGGRRSVDSRREALGTAQPGRSEARASGRASTAAQASAQASDRADPEARTKAEGQAAPKPVPVPVEEISPTSRSLSPLPPSRDLRVVDLPIGEYLDGFDDYLAMLGESIGRHCYPDPKSRRAYIAAREAGLTADDLVAAARGVRHSPWHMGVNPDRTPKNGPTTILTSNELDRLIALGRGEAQPVPVESDAPYGRRPGPHEHEIDDEDRAAIRAAMRESS